MNHKQLFFASLWATFMVISSCAEQSAQEKQEEGNAVQDTIETYNYVGDKDRLDIYTPVKLTTDMSQLAEHEKQMIPHLINASKIMDTLFWMQAYGLPDTFLTKIPNPEVAQFASINYGPWDRLNNNKPFLSGIGEKPLGANFYPHDMTKKELENADVADKFSLYTLIRRNEAGKLYSIPYHEAYKDRLQNAAASLKSAAELAQNEQLKKYLNMRSEALLNSEYDASDRAWLDLEENTLDIIIGPIENYEDKLFNAKAAFEAYILVKDKEWSERLKKYVQYLPELQNELPVAAEYKAEKPGRDAQLNAYDVIYYSGDCNSGSKTIAVNLPNDEEIQKSKGTRRSQLKNAMRAKFDEILVPISKVLINEEQRDNITFEAFFGNTMFHEVAHGLGIKNTIDGNQTVREALQEYHSALEEGKADVLGIYMVTKMLEKDVLTEGTLEDYYVTFMASIFRSIRFGAASAHGQANMIRFNYFLEKEAFTRDEETGTYTIHMDKMRDAINSLSEKILMLQGDGNKDEVAQLIEDYGSVGTQLQNDLDRLSDQDIPVDIVFEQGLSELGLE